MLSQSSLSTSQTHAVVRVIGALGSCKIHEELIVSRRFAELLLYCFLFYPSATFYLSLVLGTPIPYVADGLLIGTLLSFVVLNPFKKIRPTVLDWIFFLYLYSLTAFVAVNFSEFVPLLRIAEIRYVILIPILYFLFRFAWTKIDSSPDVYQIVRNVLLIHCICIPIEFVLLNFAIPGILQARSAALYPDNRVYEGILLFTRPNGLFPGTGNASIAASFLLLMCIHEKRFVSFRSLLSIVSVALTFTLTAGISILIGYGMLNPRSGRRFLVKLFGGLLAMLLIIAALYFQADITNFRSSGEEHRPVAALGVEGLKVYYSSIEDSFSRMELTPYMFSKASAVDAIGANAASEMYLLRVGVYFGYVTFVVLLSLMAVLVFCIFLEKSHQRRLLWVLAFLLLFASLHYPAINGVPLYLLLPLLVWRAVTMGSSTSLPQLVARRTSTGKIKQRNTGAEGSTVTS